MNTNTMNTNRQEYLESLVREGIREMIKDFDDGCYYREPCSLSFIDEGQILEVEAEISGSISTHRFYDSEPETENSIYFTADTLIEDEATLKEISSFKFDGEINS